ncbi:MAG: plasmid pRiA4b ORF-3 family protein [Bacteroidota bacterium]
MNTQQKKADLIRWIQDIENVELLDLLVNIKEQAQDLAEGIPEQNLLLKVTLEGTSKPPVWREILISNYASFELLHYVIQLSFGWYNAHLWEFSPKPFSSPRIGPKPDDIMGAGFDFEDMVDASDMILDSVFKKAKDQFYYVYDMGDSWTHKIVLKNIVDEEITFPTCVAGKGACPPEDCGGIPGYYMLVEALNNPKHPDHGQMMEWMEMEAGESWNVDAFDLIETQAEIKEVFTE